MKKLPILLLILSITALGFSQKPRARDLKIPFAGTPGKLNAITDVKGIEVGYSTIISGNGENVLRKGPVRTGVTAIFPRGKAKKFSPVYANWYSLNGNGEMTGTTWMTESGFLETPIMITNTNSVGVVRDAVLKWYVDTDWYSGEDWWYTYPVVAETYDGFLNDIYGFHVKEKHVLEAISNASSGKIAEGNVGGGTGMMCLGFKGGTGTASRMVKVKDSTYIIGVLVQSNFGAKNNLTIAGVPIGRELSDTLNYVNNLPPKSRRKEGDGSIIVVVATDAPLLPHQLKRITQRVPLGIALVGGYGSNGSGDIFIAFSTANENAFDRDEKTIVETLPNDKMTPLFEATAQAVEEAIINAMVAAETMEGINKNKAYALPHMLMIEVLNKYNRLNSSELYENTKTTQADTSTLYFGQKPPSNTPEIFAPNIISKKGEYEFGSIFNQNATEFFYGVAINGKEEIRYSKLLGNTWSEPKILLRHKEYGYNDPFLSPDENRLYFISKRALDGLGEAKDYDIWYVERLENGWSEPINAGPSINSDSDEYYTSLTDQGTLYFSSNKVGSNFDIYASKYIKGEFQEPARLGNAINTSAYEADVFIAPDESYIIFCATREDGLGRGDLYISFKNPDGTWSQSMNMGDTINTENHELCPFVSKDGKYFFYTSNQDIYWVSTAILESYKN